ncbi:hypothetical protein HDV05_003279, partial [Chytridiales sp. JEL 0842]
QSSPAPLHRLSSTRIFIGMVWSGEPTKICSRIMVKPLTRMFMTKQITVMKTHPTVVR